MNTEHRMTGKNTMYEPAARVPMVLTGPGIAPRQIRTVTSLFDVYPTVMDLMGLSALIPSDVAGGSIVPLAHGEAPPNRKDYIVSEYHSFYTASASFMIRQGDFKLIIYGPDTLFGREFPPMLFNLAVRPCLPDLLQRCCKSDLRRDGVRRTRTSCMTWRRRYPRPSPSSQRC